MKPLIEQDHYETLDVPRGAAPEEIDRAYRLACDTYTEDSLAGYPVFEDGDVALLRDRIEVAYRTLADPEARSSYDAELAGGEPGAARATPDSEDPRAASRAEEPGAYETPQLNALEAIDELDESEGEWTGARLRRVRLRQGIELDQIADATKVNPIYLRFIEEDRFEDLPAAVYLRGFVSGFAEVLGLDAKRVARGYLERYEDGKGSTRRRLFRNEQSRSRGGWSLFSRK